ncbi:MULTISPECIES: hypothetical protein [Paenibacillus]|uniref:hypothetical protein n=1 Tax=Paenibacillus TaxID=44249 RepID=UPI000C9F156D|nr:MULTISPECIES: hypothetical protein [Paenibacillus]AZH29197.1 hypothetical protein EGM68_10700 [Paenibacillus sp. M-152]KAE8558435.1 hypothetical protein BJH92_19930 [Paenibacillus polymyxa]MCJ1219761.1 hypothetical protein [Paenibacillus polymyxa]MDU8675744.1 hypothetical protein [Paenibacillus polymyxa]MDU8700651.1 hypothetical protein [Paenibacillus polymyxa]
MVLLKDSSTKEAIRVQYEQIWSELLNKDEEKAEHVLMKLEYELLPTRQKIQRRWGKILSPLKKRFIWIILLSVIGFFLLAYVLFIYVSLWVEDY